MRFRSAEEDVQNVQHAECPPRVVDTRTTFDECVIPVEIIVSIIHLLEYDDLIAMSRVCRLFNAEYHRSALWCSRMPVDPCTDLSFHSATPRGLKHALRLRARRLLKLSSQVRGLIVGSAVYPIWAKRYDLVTSLDIQVRNEATFNALTGVRLSAFCVSSPCGFIRYWFPPSAIPPFIQRPMGIMCDAKWTPLYPTHMPVDFELDDCPYYFIPKELERVMRYGYYTLPNKSIEATDLVKLMNWIEQQETQEQRTPFPGCPHTMQASALYWVYRNGKKAAVMERATCERDEPVAKRLAVSQDE